MRATIQDSEALAAVSPAALSAYVRFAGWTKQGVYGDYSDIYAGEELPEIILPRTQQIDDYDNVVSRLIQVFAKVAEIDELTLYRDLVTADRDVLRVRVSDSDGSGDVPVNDGLNLLSGAQEMILAAACSLSESRALYRAGANREAGEYLDRVRLGQTEHGSFALTLLAPIVPPRIRQALLPELELDDDPIERRVTRRLASALRASREAIEKTASGDVDAFSKAIGSGVSANLCEALVKLIEPFPSIDTSVVWARTRPMNKTRDNVNFDADDVPILREAARSFRDREPQPDTQVFGIVRTLKREEDEVEGTVSLRASIDGHNRSVVAVLEQSDYERAVQAHGAKAPVVMRGDLERYGQRWRLLNPRISDVILDEEDTHDFNGSED